MILLIMYYHNQNLTFREKSSLDFKSYKEKLDNTLAFNSQINKLLNTTIEYTKTCVKECEDRMKKYIMYMMTFYMMLELKILIMQ